MSTGDLEATTTVEVVLRDRAPTIEDIQDALDYLRAEGVPDTFEVKIWVVDDREYEKDVPRDQWKRTLRTTLQAERAAKMPGSDL